MSYAIQLTAAFIGAMSFAMYFNVRWGKLLSCAFGGLLSWAVYLLLNTFLESDVLSYFFASMALTVYAEIMARVRKSPDTVYIICAAITLVPGGSLYNTMHFAVQGQWKDFFTTGTHTLLLAAAIAVGILCMMTILHVGYSVCKSLRKLGGRKTEEQDADGNVGAGDSERENGEDVREKI